MWLALAYNYSTWEPKYIRFLMMKIELIPDALRALSSDVQILEVFYDDQLKPGNTVTYTEIMNEPHKVRWSAIEDVYYTLVLAGPDCPTRKDHNFRSWKHWIVGNILGGDLNSGEIIVPYAGLDLDFEFGIHRMLYLVYRQPGVDPIIFDREQLLSSRQNFVLEQFSFKYRLRYPVAVLFFFCKNYEVS